MNEPSKNERENETENKDRKSEHSDSPPKSQRFFIFIFSTAHLLKAILASRTNGTFENRTSQHAVQVLLKSHFLPTLEGKIKSGKHNQLKTIF